MIIESPLIQELLAETEKKTMHKAILSFLRSRFGPVPPEVAAEIRTVSDDEKLDALIQYAAFCPDLQAFRDRIRSS